MSDMMTQEEAMNMSNEQAVQILSSMRNMMLDQYGCPISDAVFAFDKAIEVLSADRPQEWIPCSERLPSEEKAIYLVCTDSEYMCSCRWTNTNPIWTDLTTDWHWCIFDIPQYTKVVAWMPLKPWKGVDDE